jgi:pimeloyl-ACP methyl ester carboxylesterase
VGTIGSDAPTALADKQPPHRLHQPSRLLSALGLGGRLLIWLVVALVGTLTALVAAVHVADGLVATAVRNTVLHELTLRLPSWLQPPDPALQPLGALRGVITGPDGRPLADAAVIVADRRGVTYRAVTDASGAYVITDLPAGLYRVAAAHPSSGPARSWFALPTASTQLGTLRWRPPVAVREQRSTVADLALGPFVKLTPTAGARLSFGEETTVEQGPPFPGTAVRRPFTLTAPVGDRLVLDTLQGRVAFAPAERSATGVVYAPVGPGQYPTIVIIYPGLPETWEAVSVALATDGFVVVAYTPLNFPDLTVDTRDLLFLTQELRAGRLSPSAAPDRQCVAGGSFSTLWTFLLVQQTDAYRCVLSLGGLSDAFLFREDWTAGRITPDPRMAPVPQMMAALGTPDVWPDLYLYLSVVDHVQALPPTLIVHGDGDTLVPINQSVRLAERMQQAGQPYELKLYSGMEHYLDPTKADADTIDLLARSLAFFHRYLD